MIANLIIIEVVKETAAMTAPTAESTVQPKGPIWPSLRTASSVADLANIALVFSLALGVISTMLIVWMSGVKEQYWDASREEAGRTIAELNKETARLGAESDNSKASVADANARAVEAQLALEKYKAPRRLPPNKLPPVMALKRFSDVKVVVFVVDGVEPTNLAAEIGHGLALAGWKAESWRWSANVAATGIVIFTKPDAGEAVNEQADALVAALRGAGLDADRMAWPSEWKNFLGSLIGSDFTSEKIDTPIRMIIGAKPD